jgi:hypothetical protein
VLLVVLVSVLETSEVVVVEVPASELVVLGGSFDKEVVEVIVADVLLGVGVGVQVPIIEGTASGPLPIATRLEPQLLCATELAM